MIFLFNWVIFRFLPLLFQGVMSLGDFWSFFGDGVAPGTLSNIIGVTGPSWVNFLVSLPVGSMGMVWMFPKIVGFLPPKSSILVGFFNYKPFILGYPYFWKHPYIYLYGWWQPEIRRSPVDMEKIPKKHRFLYIPSGCLGFLPSTVWMVHFYGKFR